MSYSPEDAEREAWEDKEYERRLEIEKGRELEISLFFDLTSEINAIDYLEQSVKFLMESHINPLSWKWVVISLHGALYGFMISTLKGAIYRNTKKDSVYAQKKGTDYIIDFKEALNRCQDINRIKMARSWAEKALILSEVEKKSIITLQKGFRNILEHPQPKHYSFGIFDIAKHIPQYFDVIDRLTFDVRNFIDNLNDFQQKQVQALCNAGKELSIIANSRLLEFEKEYKKTSQ